MLKWLTMSVEQLWLGMSDHIAAPPASPTSVALLSVNAASTWTQTTIFFPHAHQGVIRVVVRGTHAQPMHKSLSRRAQRLLPLAASAGSLPL
jgi:hypothetical protein